MWSIRCMRRGGPPPPEGLQAAWPGPRQVALACRPLVVVLLKIYALLVNISLTGGRRPRIRVYTIYTGSDWCDLDTGYTTITDGHGIPHSVYISVNRDGSVWMRAGVDQPPSDRTYTDEYHYRLQVNLLEDQVGRMIESLNYSDFCVLTDLDFTIKVEAGWHPSFLRVYNPRTKHTRVLSFNRNLHKTQQCEGATNVTLTADKQRVTCNGGQVNSCGRNNLPDKGERSPRYFIKVLKMDPRGAKQRDRQDAGPEDDQCPGSHTRNSYSFKMTYYHVFVKLASCPAPRDSRTLGHEAKLRPHRDTLTNTVVIPDPTQTALADGVIKGWQVFANIISLQHEVFLQVWRPSPFPELEDTYTLVGQNFFHPTHLRFQEVESKEDLIRVQKGDVLGLYFPKQNPIAWSSVPCATQDQFYRFLHNPPRHLRVGKTLKFQRSYDDEAACRHYSFTAIMANKTDAKLIEDWVCPSGAANTDTRKRSGSGLDPRTQGAGSSGANSATDKTPGQVMLERKHNSEGSIPIHLILIIIGGLILLLMLVGFVSYYKAIKS